MDIGNLINSVLSDGGPATAIYGLVVLSAADFLTGVAKAFSVSGDGVAGTSFKLAYVGMWAQSKGTKLINILILLIAGAASPDFNVLGFEVNPLAALGLTMAATVALELAGSIKDNVSTANRVAVPQEVAPKAPAT